MKIGILADIHEDIIRLQEAITLLKKEGCETLVCLWDLVGYSVPYYWYLASRNASQVINIVQEQCNIVVAGNHDLYACKKIPEFNGGFKYPKNWYALPYAERKELAGDSIQLYENNELSALISTEEEDYLRDLPEYVVKEFWGVNILFSHRLYPDFSGSTKREASATEIPEYRQHFDFMKQHHCSISIVGHRHIFFGFTEEKIEKLALDKSYLYENLYGFGVPSVANGTYPNGVVLFDTETKMIQWLPLWTPPHPSQARRKL